MPPRLRRAMTALAALLLVVGPTLPAASVTTAGDDAFTLLGGGGWVAGFRSERYAPPAVFGVSVDDGVRDSIDVHAMLPGGAANLRLLAPTSRPRLTVGRHTVTGAVGDDSLMFYLGHGHRACGWSPGVIDVLALSRDAGGRLTSLALDYVSTTCDSDPLPTSGSVRWNSRLPYQHTDVTDLRIPGTAADATAHGAITLTNVGGRPQTYGRTQWQPETTVLAHQSPLAIRRDGCVGVTLQPGASCRVEVSVRADGVHGVAGHLRTPDGTSRGAAYASVAMPVPPEPVLVVAVPLRGGVQLHSARFNASYRVLRSTDGGPETEVARDVPMPWTDTAVREGRSYRYRVVVVDSGAESRPSHPVTSGPLPVPVGQDGRFVSVDPVRVLDTRVGTGGHRGAVGPEASVRFDPGGRRRPLPAGVRAVLLNVTATGPTSATHVRAWPAGTRMPRTSSLNVAPGQTRPNLVVVPVGADGLVSLYNHRGRTHLLADLQGLYVGPAGPGGGGYHPTAPVRMVDTRTHRWALRPGETAWLPMDGPGVVWSEVAAVDLNLTVTAPTAHGHLTAWAGDGPAPSVSNVNFAPGQTVANHAVVPVGFDGSGRPGISVRNSAGSTHLVVDLQGWYDDGARADGLRFRPSPSSRVADTRTGEGIVSAKETLVVRGTSMPPGLVQVVNVTATGSSGAGHLTAWSGLGRTPRTSTLNFAAREDSANLATVVPALGGAIAVTAASSGVHVVVDHVGFFY